MKHNQISIILPCRNEELSIGPFFEKLLEVKLNFKSLDFNLIYIDDGSTDNTWRNIQEIKKRSKLIRVIGIQLKVSLGKTAAQAVGLKAIAHYDTPVIFMDADGQHSPNYLRDILEGFLQTNVTYIGKRITPHRTFIVKVGVLILQIWGKVIKIPFENNLCEFILISSENVSKIITQPQFGTAPLLSLSISVDKTYKTFDCLIEPRIDGTSSTRFSIESLVEKAFSHLMMYPYQLFIRLILITSVLTFTFGAYALVVGIISIISGSLLGVGSILFMQVVTLVTVSILQIFLITVVILQIKQKEKLALITAFNAIGDSK